MVINESSENTMKQYGTVPGQGAYRPDFMDAFETKPQPSSTPASLCTELGSNVVNDSVERQPAAAPLVEQTLSWRLLNREIYKDSCSRLQVTICHPLLLGNRLVLDKTSRGSKETSLMVTSSSSSFCPTTI